MMQTPGRGVGRFFFPVGTDSWLALLRIGLGLEVIALSVSLAKDWLYFFAAKDEGLMSRRLSEAMAASQSPFLPTLAWLVVPAQKLGLTEHNALAFAWWLLLLSGLFLVLGFASRAAAITAWLVHLAASQSGTFLSYGVDQMITIGLFYLALAPLPDRFAIETHLFRFSPARPELFGFFRRLLQLHLCFIYLSGGLAKALGSGWWTGANLWRALTRPPFNVLPPEMIARVSWLLLPAGLLICAIELGYPFFVWRESLRRPWLCLICAMHIGIAIFMGLYLFGMIMVILNVAAFGPAMPNGRRRLPSSGE